VYQLEFLDLAEALEHERLAGVPPGAFARLAEVKRLAFLYSESLAREGVDWLSIMREEDDFYIQSVRADLALNSLHRYFVMNEISWFRYVDN
jgi:hypothetical protein